MLAELSITNFAIIDELRLSFVPGLNVITGETGAGKSIIVDALGDLLGDRVDTAIVRSGQPLARIEGCFQLELSQLEGLRDSKSLVFGLLEEQGLGAEEGVLVLSREVNTSGRSLCRLNGRAVTLGVLQQIGQKLVDIHGQSEHLSLLRSAEHIDILDRYAGLAEERCRLAKKVVALRQVRQQLRQLRQDEREMARQAELLTFQVKEIAAAQLKPGEEETLELELELLSNAEQRARLANEAYVVLRDGVGEHAGVFDSLAEMTTKLRELARLDTRRSEEAELVQSLLLQLGDLADTLRSYRDQIEFSPARLAQVEERLELIRGLKRKYGATIEEVLQFAEKAAHELEGITHREERVSELEARERALLGEAGEMAAALSSQRQRAAQELTEAIKAQMKELALLGGRFAVNIWQEEVAEGLPVGEAWYAFDEMGIDKVEFQVSMNPDHPLKPLAKVASGGETSRLMLALKSVLSQVDVVDTLIFDEIEAGIGGRSGPVVGQKLSHLAAKHQVICVTHLPQVACFGDAHYYVSKGLDSGRTRVEVRLLSTVEREEELARMLGGLSLANRQSAKEMLRVAEAWKKSRVGLVA